MKQARWWMACAAAGAVGLAGYFGPWAPHRAAGLVVLGVDLAEIVKFLPAVASGQIALRREIFYLPLLAGSIGAGLLAGRRAVPMGLRVLLALAVLPLALAMLPPAWSPAVLRQAEFRWQVTAIGVCLALLPGIALTRRLPHTAAAGTLAILALGAAGGPVWGFLQVRPALAEVYGHPLPLGWGFWACLIGFGGTALLAVISIWRGSKCYGYTKDTGLASPAAGGAGERRG